jgi:hypothetical protein
MARTRVPMTRGLDTPRGRRRSKIVDSKASPYRRVLTRARSKMHLDEVITERTKIYASRLRAVVLLVTLLCSACAGATEWGVPPAVPTPSIALAPVILPPPSIQPTPAPTSTPAAKPGTWHGSGPEPKRHWHGKHGNYEQNAPKRSRHPANPEPTPTKPAPAPSDRPPYWPLEHLNDQ